MRPIETCIAIILAILLLMMVSCGVQTAGVETTNGAIVVVSEAGIEGTTPPFATVYLFDTCYIPYIDIGIGIAVSSDENGYFSLSKMPVRAFNIGIFDIENKLGAIMKIGTGSKEHRSELKASGKLRGEVESSAQGPILVYISGNGYYTLLKGEGEFLFNSLPPSLYTVEAALLKTSTDGEKPRIVSMSGKIRVNVYSGQTTEMTEKMVIP